MTDTEATYRAQQRSLRDTTGVCTGRPRLTARLYRRDRASCLTCLTRKAPRNAELQALSQKRVQITYATELANGNISVYALMKLLGHDSMVTSQRYVDGAGVENRAAAAENPLYGLIENAREP